MTRAHVDEIELQEAQEYVRDVVTDDYSMLLADQTFAFTGISDGKPLICAGLAPLGYGRAMAWCLMSRDAGKCFVSIHRAVVRMLDQTHFRRVEAVVDSGFDAGGEWLDQLGFTHEGTMRSFFPWGDVDMYARVK